MHLSGENETKIVKIRYSAFLTEVVVASEVDVRMRITSGWPPRPPLIAESSSMVICLRTYNGRIFAYFDFLPNAKMYSTICFCENDKIA